MTYKLVIETPLDALRYLAWTEFSKVAGEIDNQRNDYINRESFMLSGNRTSPYLIQESKNKFLLDMGLEKPANLDYTILPPPAPSHQQIMEMAKHRDTFLRTFIPDSQERLAALIGHYDEEFAALGSDELWMCKESLSARPRAEDLPVPPVKNKDTHPRILCYAWNNISREYQGDFSNVDPRLTLSWINEFSPTIAGQLAEPKLTS